MCRRGRRVEERFVSPDVDDVEDAKRAVLEQVRQLVSDFERVIIVEEIQVEEVLHKGECIINEYKLGADRESMVLRSVQGCVTADYA